MSFLPVSPMAIATKVIRWIAAGFIASGLLSCSAWTVLSQQDHASNTVNAMVVSPIANLTADSLGKDIYIKGKVRQKAPFLNSGAYEIQDQTGSIWVITQRPLPQPGTEVFIAGQLSFHNLQLQQNNFGELFIQEIQFLDPSLAVETAPSPPTVTPPKTPIQKRPDFEFLPHKDNNKP